MYGYYLLNKNDKGFFTTDGFKIYFADRKSNLDKVGVITNVEVTLDKEKFAFIKGSYVTGKFPTLQDIKDLIPSYRRVESITIGQVSIGSCDCLALSWEDCLVVVTMIDDSPVVVFNSRQGSTTAAIRQYNNWYSYISKNLNKLGFEDILNIYGHNNTALAVTTSAKLLLIAKAISHARHNTHRDFKVLDVVLINNFVVKLKYSSIEGTFTSYFFAFKKGTETSFYKSDNFVIAEDDVIETFKPSDIRDFILRNHLTFGYGGTADSYHFLTAKKFTGFQESVTLYCYDVDEVTDVELSMERPKELVEKSHEELDSLLKRVAKFATAKNIEELANLRPQSWVLGNVIF